MEQNSDLPALRPRVPGLLWAYGGGPNGETVRFAADELPAAIAAGQWVWVHVDLIDQRARAWIQGICDLPTEVTTLLAGQEVGLVFEHDGREIHGVCADFNADFLRVSDSIGQFGFVARERLVVTGWRHPLAGIDAVRQAARSGVRYASGYEVLAAICAAFCRVAFLRLRSAETDLDRVEDQLLAARAADERTALKEVRRLGLALHRPVTAMQLLLHEAVEDEEEAEEAKRPTLPPAGVAAIEDMATRLAAVDHAVRATSDRAKLLQEEMAAELADESNRSLRALTVMTALLLPGSLVAGIFGMNTGGLPFAGPGWGTLGAVLFGVVATVVFYRILARAGASLKF